MENRFCPYCGASLSGIEGARFCPNCGKRIDGGGRNHRQNRQRRERYEIQSFSNATVEQVDRWFQEANPTIIGYTGRLTCSEGLLKNTWFFSYLKIKYYPRHPEYVQGWYLVPDTDSLFSSARSKCDKRALRHIEAKHGELIGSPIYSEYHYSGGNGAKSGCEFIFYRVTDEGGENF